MALSRAFISFDYDHDETLKVFLIGQSKHPDTPFELADWSIKEAIQGDWQKKALMRIKAVDVVIVLCGEHTDTAAGVSAELRLAQSQQVPYFLLAGYSDRVCKKPLAAKPQDKLYNWSWSNLKQLIGGAR